MQKSTHPESPKIAIQGYAGSFHEEAAQQFFTNCTSEPCDTFRLLVQHVSNSTVDAGVMAIENSIAGSILPNYTLLQKSPVTIIGEVYLHIKQHLLVNPGVKLEDISEVHSHPMALLQCMEYLEKHSHYKLVETEDTALSAKHIHQRRSKHQAAIAGRMAANLYNMEIAVANIHTMKKNYTRFLVLKHQKQAQPVEEANKASLLFVTDHSKGSLASALTIVARNGINLSKLQSMPIPGTEFRYAFHADMEFEDIKQFQTTLHAFEKANTEVRVFGLYKNGKAAL